MPCSVENGNQSIPIHEDSLYDIIQAGLTVDISGLTLSIVIVVHIFKGIIVLHIVLYARAAVLIKESLIVNVAVSLLKHCPRGFCSCSYVSFLLNLVIS